MKILAVLLLTAATSAAAVADTGASVTVLASNLSFKQSMTACPGALAGITFTLGHVRIAEQPGVVSDLDDANPNAQVLTLQDAGGASATVTIDAKARTVSAKNVKLSGKNVACVSKD